MGLNNIVKVISIIVAMAVCSTSHAGSKSVFITTDKGEIRQAIEQLISSKNKKKAYLDLVNECKSLNQYKFKAKKNTPNEIEFIQTESNLAIFQMVDKEFQLDGASGSNREISKLIFKRLDDKNILINVERVSYENPSTPNRLYYEVNANFAQGTWADLAENRAVTIAVSPQEELKSKKFIQDWMQRKVFHIAVQRGGSFVKAVLPKTALEFKAPLIKGNLDQMVHTVNKTKMKFEIQWGIL